MTVTIKDGGAQRKRRTLQEVQPCSQHFQHVDQAGSPGRYFSSNFSGLGMSPELPQHLQSPLFFQTNERARFLETSETLSSLRPTPFRPMTPREFSLGNNIRRMYPDMPLRTLPSDVKRSPIAARVPPKKSEANANVPTSANISRVAPKNADATSIAGGPVRSIFFTRRTSTCSRRSSMSTLRRIPEEEDSISSGFSSNFSASGMDNAARVGCIGEVFLPTQSSDDDSGFLSLGEIKKVVGQAVDVLSTLLVKDVQRSGDKSMTRLVPPVVSGIINPTPTASSEEDQSISDSSGSSFLSWNESRRSVEYIRSEQYQSKLQQELQQNQEAPKQDLLQNTQHGSMHDYKQLQELYSSSINAPSYRRKLSQDSTESIPSQCPTPSHQSYHRKSSQESNDSSLSQSPTPFRPMLPRELLLPFKFPEVPFPTLPADATPSAVRRMSGKAGRICPPQA
jgi:hypothetical protein